jgi:hypothetical protein
LLLRTQSGAGFGAFVALALSGFALVWARIGAGAASASAIARVRRMGFISLRFRCHSREYRTGLSASCLAPEVIAFIIHFYRRKA